MPIFDLTKKDDSYIFYECVAIAARSHWFWEFEKVKVPE